MFLRRTHETSSRRRFGRRRADGDRGLAMVEMAIVAPLLALLVGGLVEYGLLWRDNLTVTMTEAYFDERLAEGMRIQDWMLYSDLPVSRAEVARLQGVFNRHLLDDRNRAWIKVIERTQGPVLVVAVGAAHLPGKVGLLNLLKARGYSLERAPF